MRCTAPRSINAPLRPCLLPIRSSETDHDTVVRTLNRSTLAAIQTPQAFCSEIIKAALTRAIAEKKEYTDDCAAVEAMGVKVHLSKGSPENIKITGPVDIPTAAAILKTRGEVSGCGSDRVTMFTG